MLKVLLVSGEQPAFFDLPHDPMEVEQYMLSSGHYQSYDNIFLLDNDDPNQLQVKLIADNAADYHLQYLFPEDAKLSTVNTVCDVFYRLPIEKQIDLTHGIADNMIVDYKELLDAIKNIKMEESSATAIVFSRVKLWSDTGEEAVFFMSGEPGGYDDIEDHEDCIDFKEFLEQMPDANLEGITAFVTTFTEGEGECVPASEADIDQIYSVIADVDIDIITGWNKMSESQFAFDYDIDEQPGMTEME